MPSLLRFSRASLWAETPSPRTGASFRLFKSGLHPDPAKPLSPAVRSLRTVFSSAPGFFPFFAVRLKTGVIMAKQEGMGFREIKRAAILCLLALEAGAWG